MKKKKIIIAGGSGFLGKSLIQHLGCEKYQYLVLSRSHHVDTEDVAYVKWNTDELFPWYKKLENADVLINLAGRSVNCRYTKQHKEDIYDSRLQSTAILQKAIKMLNKPPEVWINSSTATIYRHETLRPNTEAHGIIGKGFSVDVAKKWEACFFDESLPATRKVALRTAIALGAQGDVFTIYKNHVKMMIGGRHGTGNQMVSWLHEKDFAGIIEFVIQNKEVRGVLNAAAPNAVKDKQFMECFRKVLQVPFAFPLPAWSLKIGAFFLRTEPELILKSRWVFPERLLQLGYRFHFENIEDALQDLYDKTKKAKKLRTPMNWEFA